MKTRKERKYYVSFHLMNPKERKNEIKMLLSKIKEGKAMFGGVKEAKIEIHNTSLSLVIYSFQKEEDSFNFEDMIFGFCYRMRLDDICWEEKLPTREIEAIIKKVSRINK